MRAKLLLLTILFFCPSSYAQTIDELFLAGLNSYQGGKFEEAENTFQQVLTQQPNNTSVLYNLGLALYKSGKVGPAIASWRKALFLDPSLSDARDAILFATSKLEHKELPHEVMLLERLRSSYLQWISLNQLLFALAITLFAFGWMTITYLGKRKSAQLNGDEVPPLSITYFVFLAALVLVGFSSGAKLLDLSNTRATVVLKSVNAHAGPDNEQATLFELYEGLEVLVNDVQNNWLKVTYPGGRSGWIPSESVHITK